VSSPDAVSSKIFGRNLKKTREIRGLTQAELGHRAGMAGAAVSHFETGQRAPSLDSLVKLADALDVSTDQLLGRASASAPPRVDPIFVRASRANSQTLDVLRRVTAALLAGTDLKPGDRPARGEEASDGKQETL
jgi:transcriptional regulator with XRE-family HTH domain